MSINNSQKNNLSLPCRINDENSREVLIMTLGEVNSALANGKFYPELDEVRLNDGSTISNYFKKELGIKYYKPIDKTVFKTAPTGWCSWYYYYQEIDENEIKLNAKWLAENLKDYGLEYVNIDDGWQGKGHGIGDNRDWTVINERFKGGLNTLAGYIKELGLKPGIWIAPHGQSNPEIVKQNKNVFLINPDYSSALKSWEGDYLVDPSTLACIEYLKSLFRRLRKYGYEFFKLDGQNIVALLYKDHQNLMKNPDDPETLYRRTLSAIKSSAGDKTYILGSWGIPLEGAGIMNGARIGNDITLSWSGFKAALSASLRYNYLNNIVWYNDPDVILLRNSLSLEQVKAWATLIGLSGQMVITSDRMTDLSESRVEVLKRILPTVNIHPMDLFPSKRTKHVLDLKVNHLNREYDIVSVFNFDDNNNYDYFLKWEDMGFAENALVHVFDFWNSEYLGAIRKGIFVSVAPASCKVLTLMSADENIKLISTNRHITQGFVELSKINYEKERNIYSGTSKVLKNDNYEIYFTFPKGKNFMITEATADGIIPQVSNHQNWATVRFQSSETKEINWQVKFERASTYKHQLSIPDAVSILYFGIDGVRIKWKPQYDLNAGFNVYLNNKLIGYTPTTEFVIRNLEIHSEYCVIVKAVWDDGTESESSEEAKFKLSSILPEKLFLDEIESIVDYSGWGIVEKAHCASGNHISVGGKTYRRGVGTHANSEIIYDIKGLFKYFAFVVGIDDNNDNNSNKIEFNVYGDGKKLWGSGVVNKSNGSMNIKINIEGIQKLLLEVLDGGDGIDKDYADWANAYLSI